jgi:tetratricopeptide (TPR) repeat protein
MNLGVPSPKEVAQHAAGQTKSDVSTEVGIEAQVECEEEKIRQLELKLRDKDEDVECDVKALIVKLNKVATLFAAKGELVGAMASVTRAHELLQQHQRQLSQTAYRKLRCMTLVNAAHLEYRCGNWDKAVLNFTQSMLLGPLSTEGSLDLADSLLKLGSWQEAEIICRQAIVLLLHKADARQNADRACLSGTAVSPNTTKSHREKMLLVKAYSNVAVSQQQLGHNPEEVLKAYETALRLARMEFGRDHPITKEVDAVYSEHLGTEAVRKATRRPQQGAAPAKGRSLIFPENLEDRIGIVSKHSSHFKGNRVHGNGTGHEEPVTAAKRYAVKGESVHFPEDVTEGHGLVARRPTQGRLKSSAVEDDNKPRRAAATYSVKVFDSQLPCRTHALLVQQALDRIFSGCSLPSDISILCSRTHGRGTGAQE